MTECIAMAVGVLLGAGCAIFAQMQSAKCKVQNEGDPSALPQDDTRVEKNETRGKSEEGRVKNAEEREKLKKQWENFMNYGGSEEGQMEIEN